jgi:threonine dehydrogenase-like Zn-dependent dehydrogenase
VGLAWYLVHRVDGFQRELNQNYVFSPPPHIHEREKQEIPMSDVIVVIGAGSIGQAIARRVSAGKHVVLADLNPDNADAAEKC